MVKPARSRHTERPPSSKDQNYADGSESIKAEVLQRRDFITTACTALSITYSTMYAKIALVLAAAALSANAQIGLDACIINCSAAAASAAGCSS